MIGPPAYLDLSDEQESVLDSMPFDGNHLVTGPPGSGKTLVALHRAAMLWIAGRRVELLSYSNLLRQSTTTAADALKIDVPIRTYHSWLNTYFRGRFGEAPPAADGDTYAIDWPLLCSRVIESGVDSSHQGRDLVVDEGQDLPEQFYLCCGFLGVNVTVCADEHQCITERQSTLAEIDRALRGPARYELTADHRTTREIAEFAARYRMGPPAPLPVRRGPVPTVTRHASLTAFAATLAAHVATHPDQAIGVALRRPYDQKRLFIELERLGVRGAQTYMSAEPRYRTVDFTRPGVRIFNVRSMKGLEFDALFVPDLHLYGADATSPATRMLVYMLFTRPREELHLGYEGHTPPTILS